MVKLDIGEKRAKTLFFVFNLFFFLSGLAIIAVGAVATGFEPEYVSLIGTEEFTIGIVMIVVGCIATIVSFFGCCGAMKNNTCMLYTFSTLLTIIVLVELACSITAFVYQDQIQTDVTTNMQSTMKDYKTNPQIAKEWDNMQEQIYCCGVEGPDDWRGPDFPKGPPDSCCMSLPHCSWTTPALQQYYSTGCITQESHNLKSYAWVIAGVALGVAVIQLFGIGIACCLATSLKRLNRIH